MHDWIEKTHAQLDGTGPEWGCEQGHEDHSCRGCDVVLSGPHEHIPDYPPIPRRLEVAFHMNVWDWEPLVPTRLDQPKRYCPQDDIVSECVETQGVWEGYGTNLVLDLLALPRRANDVVIDMGSQIGWYTMLSTSSGYPVLAIDADATVAEMLRRTTEGQDVLVARCGLDETTPVLEPLETCHARFVKMDVEGAEDHAVRIIEPLLDRGQVDFILMEVSPCFDDYYPDLCAHLVEDHGFTAYLVPGKNEDLDGFGTDPLAALSLAYRIPDDELKSTVESWVQRDVLFVHGGLEAWTQQ